MLKFSTFTELFENEGLKKKAAKSGISLGTLKKVYNRGMAAWKTGHRPGTNPQQWGMARVNSYIGKGKGTYYGADSDLSGKGKKKSKKEDTNEAIVKEISKSKARRYIGYAARDVFNLGKRDQAASDIGRLGGKHPDQDYQKGPERKAAKRVGGIDRATKILMKKNRKEAKRVVVHSNKPDSLKSVKVITPKPKKNEATTSDAERKAIDDFIKKGKMKKLKPGYAQGYHGKSDPAAGMKGMMDKGDTKAFGTKKKVGSMK